MLLGFYVLLILVFIHAVKTTNLVRKDTYLFIPAAKKICSFKL